MLLSDIFTHLESGELAHISMSGGDGSITQEDYPSIIPHINIALSHLYSRLPLKLDQVLVRQDAERSLYPLLPEYAVSSGNSDSFILDSVEKPFKGDVLKVEQAFLIDGSELPVNDTTYPEGLFTPTPTTLQFGAPVTDNIVSVIYRAKHLPINPTITDASAISVELPQYLLEPLMLYVTSRMVRSRGTSESLSEANNLMMQFEQLLMLYQQAGLNTKDITSSTKLEKNGWV